MFIIESFFYYAALLLAVNTLCVDFCNKLLVPPTEIQGGHYFWWEEGIQPKQATVQ